MNTPTSMSQLTSNDCDLLLSLTDSELEAFLQSLPETTRAATLHQLYRYEPPKRKAEASLHEFVKQAWPIIEPKRAFLDNWHIQAICEHLQAVTEGHIRELLINVPPGCMKSILCNVCWPAWEWGPKNRPFTGWLHASYAHDLTVRDARKCRDLINSQWFQSQWPIKFADDQNQKGRFANLDGGWRFSTSVGGQTTGEHPSRIVVDDPHNAAGITSNAERNAVIDWFDGGLSTRGVGIGASLVMIMQRLHDKDLSGHILDGGSIDHICLPMRFEHERMKPTSIGWTDPRKIVGELLWPAMFPEEKVAKTERRLGPAKAAGQYQQRPPSKFAGAEWPSSYFEGDVWFTEWPEESRTLVKVVCLDPSLGRTEKSDYSAFVKLAVRDDGVLFVDADIERRDTKEMTRIAHQVGREFRPSGFGVEANGFQSLLAGQFREESARNGFMLPIFEITNRENKLNRIRRLTPYLADRRIKFKAGSAGAELLVEMLKAFPGHLHDDGPDALEMAIRLARELWDGAVGQEDEDDEPFGRVVA